MELSIEKEQDYSNQVSITVKATGGFMSLEDMSSVQDAANTIIAIAEKYFAPPKEDKAEAAS